MISALSTAIIRGSSPYTRAKISLRDVIIYIEVITLPTWSQALPNFPEPPPFRSLRSAAIWLETLGAKSNDNVM